MCLFCCVIVQELQKQLSHEGHKVAALQEQNRALMAQLAALKQENNSTSLSGPATPISDPADFGFASHLLDITSHAAASGAVPLSTQPPLSSAVFNQLGQHQVGQQQASNFSSFDFNAVGGLLSNQLGNISQFNQSLPSPHPVNSHQGGLQPGVLQQPGLPFNRLGLAPQTNRLSFAGNNCGGGNSALSGQINAQLSPGEAYCFAVCAYCLCFF